MDGTPMTSPLSPEAVAQLVADREAGTPGPWHFDGPVWNQIVWTDGENRLCFMAHSNGLNDDRDIANASRIARLPDLEAAYLTLAAENATLARKLDAAQKTGETYRLANRTNLDRANAAEAELATLRASEAAALDRVAVLEDALNGCIAAIEHADMADGVCCCGDNMEGHSEPMNCGHSPVDMGEYHAHQVLIAARAAISLPIGTATEKTNG